MKYNEPTTIDHEKAKTHGCCLQTINSIIQQEGGGKDSISTGRAINVDSLELHLCNKEKRKTESTADMAVGLKHSTRNEKKMLLVEFKFNCKNASNITKDDIVSKIKGSKNALGHSITFADKMLLIFSNNQKAQARRRIDQLFSNKNPVCEVCVLREFKSNYFTPNNN